jgi:hypothetical protein
MSCCTHEIVLWVNEWGLECKNHHGSYHRITGHYGITGDHSMIHKTISWVELEVGGKNHQKTGFSTIFGYVWSWMSGYQGPQSNFLEA